jgi:hypothetical protein
LDLTSIKKIISFIIYMSHPMRKPAKCVCDKHGSRWVLHICTVS